MKFEWDPKKDRLNQKKHGVKFEEAVEVFEDEYRIEEFDDREDYGEDRLRVLGLAQLDLLVVVVTERREDLFRLISARRATPLETLVYEKARGLW